MRVRSPRGVRRTLRVTVAAGLAVGVVTGLPAAGALSVGEQLGAVPEAAPHPAGAESTARVPDLLPPPPVDVLPAPVTGTPAAAPPAAAPPPPPAAAPPRAAAPPPPPGGGAPALPAGGGPARTPGGQHGRRLLARQQRHPVDRP